MTYICFLCKSKFSVSDLIDHLKNTHKTPNFFTYECGQINCFQIFSERKSFKRHLLNVHRHDNLLETLPTKTSNCKTNYSTVAFDNSCKDVDKTIDNIGLCNLVSQSEIIPSQNLTNSLQNLDNIVNKITLNFYSKSNFCRKDVTFIQNNVSDLCKCIVDCLQNADVLKNNTNANQQNIISKCSDPFANINTEYLFTQKIKTSGLFSFPINYTINNEIAPTIQSGKSTLDEVKSKGYFLPLKFQIKKFLELPEILNLVLENMEALQKKGSYSNFINGSLFEEKKSMIQGSGIVLPFFLYTDDFETNNPLGSHSSENSVCAIYYSFPTLPSHLLSNLDYIFVAGFVKSKYISQFGNNSSFYPIVEEIKTLECDGIEIEANNSIYKIYPVLGLVLGDNLGVKNLLGFGKSFNISKYCRLCDRTKTELRKDLTESTLRSVAQYNEDVLKNDYQSTGVKQYTIFNEISSFHAVTNFSADVMHDIFEGICKYEISQVIRKFLEEDIFSLEQLNNMKSMFTYGVSEIQNLSPPIQLKHLKNNTLKMSAREVWHFLHFLPLLIGDIIPTNNRYWKLICLLIEIIDIVLSPEFSRDDINNLKHKIKLHHKLYRELFGALKPKHHFLLHYPTIIEKSGPLKYFWSFRFEAKHKDIKKYAHSISSRLNIAYSLSVKSSYRFSSFISSFNVENISTIHFQSQSLVNLIIFDNEKYSQLNFPENMTNVFLPDLVTYKGTEYRKLQYLTAFIERNLFLYKVKELVISLSHKFFVICTKININKFNNHFQSYEVGNSEKHFEIHEINYFSSPPLHIYTLKNGKTFLRNKRL